MATSYCLTPSSAFLLSILDCWHFFSETQRKGSWPERWKAWLWGLQLLRALSPLLTNTFLLASFVSSKQNSVVLEKKTARTWDFRWFNFVCPHPTLQFPTCAFLHGLKWGHQLTHSLGPASVSTTRWRKSIQAVSKSVVEKIQRFTKWRCLLVEILLSKQERGS